jgi:hypothetical protein
MITLFFLLFTPLSPASEYVRFSELKKEVRSAFELQRQATIPLHFEGMFCSAVYVGDQGEALTNLHCLEKCLVAQNDFTETVVNGITLRHPKEGASCDVKFGSPKLTTGNMKLLHVFGPGWLSAREKLPELIEKNPAEMARLMSEGYEASGDLALVQLPVAGPCVRLGDSLEGTLTNAAFPLIARKKSGNPMDPIFLTMGTTQLWSQGAAATDPALLLEKAPQFADFLPFVLPRGTLISEVDTESGSSGSPLFAADGSLVGLVRATWKGETTAYAPWTSQAVNLLEKKDRIQALVPANKDCR